MKLDLSRRDVGRLLSLTTERRRKLDRGVSKFGNDFDPALGANMIESQKAFVELEQALMEAMNNEDHNSRGDGRDPRQHEGRRRSSGYHRPTREQAHSAQ